MVLVLRRGRAVRAGRVLGLSGARRRRSSFLREDHNWFVLRVEVVTVAWDPRPREPVEGVLRATSVLELAATRRTPELRGKWWLGQWRAEFPPSVFASRVVVTTSSSTEFPTVGETSQQQQGARRAEETGR
ncbi:hypothetical protein Taro_007544 [Colocasia esculenta]|uniref:Uncharacterized protein n=1 Tax=Colocasia esculenta TaxID=4460 RepID=A0A843TRK0_COLES|nr:hypothetical protein [Colocasia esculenta]